MRRTLAFAGPLAGTDDTSASFHAEFEVDAADLEAPAYLHIGGIATVGRVLVNGREVWATSSMWASASAEIGSHLSVGPNRVEVRCAALPLDELPRRPRARWRTRLVDESRLRWVRTSILGRAPGFAPAPPVVGPWRPIVLETRCPIRVSALTLTHRLSGDTGILHVAVEIEQAAESNPVHIDVEVDGPTGRVVVPVSGGLAHIELPDVARWWPHTHGPPSLYDVRVLADGRPLDLPGDGTADPSRRRVGFRDLRNDPAAAAAGTIRLQINAVPVFCRGAVWTPGDLTALDRAVELGLNLVRVSGVTTYESDAFHQRCDELGLLVWQDLMFATFDYPLADEDFAALCTAEARQQAGRLLGHPSTVVVCGSAEHEQQAAMFGISPHPEGGPAKELSRLLRPAVEAVGLDALWVDSTPCGGDPVTRVDRGVAQYFGVGGYRRPITDVRSSHVGFAAECLAFSNLAEQDTTGAEGGVPRDNGADWDFADVRRHYLRERYGERASPAAERRVTGEVMAEVFAEWRRPDSGCGGGIVLWLRDLRPGAGWGLLDHTGRPKPAARALAPTLAPTAVWILDEGLNGLDVHIAHDPPYSVDLSVSVELVRDDGIVVASGAADWRMPGHAHRVFGVEALVGRFADVSYAYRFGDPQHRLVRARLSGEHPGGTVDTTVEWHLSHRDAP